MPRKSKALKQSGPAAKSKDYKPVSHKARNVGWGFRGFAQGLGPYAHRGIGDLAVTVFLFIMVLWVLSVPSEQGGFGFEPVWFKYYTYTDFMGNEHSAMYFDVMLWWSNVKDQFASFASNGTTMFSTIFGTNAIFPDFSNMNPWSILGTVLVAPVLISYNATVLVWNVLLCIVKVIAWFISFIFLLVGWPSSWISQVNGWPMFRYIWSMDPAAWVEGMFVYF